MTLPLADSGQNTVIPHGTSGRGFLKMSPRLVIRVSGTLVLQGTASVETWPHPIEVSPAVEQTSTGRTDFSAPQAAIAELRRRSGLTWDQVARLFGVARRSVHFWASGKALSATNEERLGRLLAVIRLIDQGGARETRSALMTALGDGTIPFDLLVADKLDEVVARVELVTKRAIVELPPLAPAEHAARMPISPELRVGALHDTIHRDSGRARGAKVAKVKTTR